MTVPQKFLTTSDGVRIAYSDEGDGQPVVLVHGLLCHGGHWKFQKSALVDAGYRVVAIDLRFHGTSESPSHGHSIARLGQDVGEVIAHEKLHDLVLVGHSMGVSVALAYLSLHGSSSTSRFVAIDQSPRIMNDATWPWGVRHVTWPTMEAQITGRMAWSEFEREPAAPAHVRQMLDEVGGIGDFLSSPLMLRVDHFVSDWRDIVSRVDVPAWVVTGAHSPSFPLDGMQWIADTMPHARLTIYPHSGHCPHWNEYEDFNRDLFAFLAERPDQLRRP